MELGLFCIIIVLFIFLCVIRIKSAKNVTNDENAAWAEEHVVTLETDIKIVSDNQIIEIDFQKIVKWSTVRPVVIYFGGERFVITYDKLEIGITCPLVGMVHCLLEKNLIDEKNYH